MENQIFKVEIETGEVKDAEGYDILVDIENEEDRQKVIEFISDLIS